MRCIPMLTDASALEMAERVGDGLWRLPTSIVRFSHTLGQHPGLRRFRDAGRNRPAAPLLLPRRPPGRLTDPAGQRHTGG